MKAVPPWVFYTVSRVLMFAVPLGILLAVGVMPWLAATIAAIAGFCLSYIFLSSAREKVAQDLYNATHRTGKASGDDAESEDAAIDDAERRSAAPARNAASVIRPAASGSEREGGAQQDAVHQPGEAGEFQGKNQLG